MKMVCCGLAYSTKDPETYWCIETFKLKKPFNNILEGKKIVKEVVYTLLCKKNGCTKIELHSYASDKNVVKIIQKKTISGKGAISFLEKYKEQLIKQPQICPLKASIPSKKIPWVYGKAINGVTQIQRYLDESGSPNYNCIDMPVKRYKTKITNPFGDGLMQIRT